MAPGRCPTVRRNPPVNHSTNRTNVDINSGIDTQMLNQLIAIKVAKALAAAALLLMLGRALKKDQSKSTLQIRACNYKNSVNPA
ncbi:hypothetical protein Tco_0046895 [Tanacetum coccineum]